jgi:protein-arginine kinase activator protein McsA
MCEQDKIYKNLVKLLKMFGNRPNHLAKWFVDNMAFTNSFIELIAESEKLNELENNIMPVFKDIEEMTNFYDISKNFSSKKKSFVKVMENLKERLEEYIRLEKYEDAGMIRDYMITLNNKNK